MIDSVSDTGATADLKKTRRRKNIASVQSLDRLPPNATEAEQGSLGCCLLTPNDCVGECVEKFKNGGSEVYYDLRNRTIYETLVEMFDKREAIDVITLQQRLKDK